MTSLARRAAGGACAGAALLLAAACAPPLDWREVRPDGTRLVLLMPCRPGVHERQTQGAEAALRLTLYACEAGGRSWGLAHADVADPARVGSTLLAWRTAFARGIGAGPGESLPLRVAGATPQPAGARLRYEGHRPDGSAIQAQLALFSHGTQVFQATALGDTLPAAADGYFESLRFLP